MDLKDRIQAYVSKISVPVAERATADTSLDCWDCCMYVPPDNVPMGDFYHSYEHLLTHIERGEYQGSLLINAWLEKSGSTKQPPSLEALRDAVREYLEKRLLPTGGSPLDQKGSTRPGGLSA